jgi:hypothetical protein
VKLHREREYSKRHFIFQEATSINTCLEKCGVWKTARMQIGELNQGHIWYTILKYEERSQDS